jgi:CcmD family protein
MNSGLVSVLVVTLVTWLGLFAYLLFVDRSVRSIERKDEDSDDL